MKLVALWVERYIRIVNAGFNFGSRFNFKFVFDKDERVLRIELEQTPDFYDLFSNDKIVNITGIIGANGSGKTSLLKLLNVMDAKMPLSDSVVLIFEQDNKFQIFKYEQLTTSRPVHIDIEDIYAPLFKKTISGFPYNSVDLVFYSNLYSPADNDKMLKVDNKLNRSVSYQTSSSLRPERIQEYLNTYVDQVQAKVTNAEQSFNLLSLYERDKLERLILFLSEVHANHIELKHIVKRVNFPKYLTLTFKSEFLNAIKSPNAQSKVKPDLLVTLYKHCYEVNRSFSIRIQLENEIITEIFFYAIYNDLSFQAQGEQLYRLDEFLNSLLNGKNQFTGNGIFSALKKYLIEENKESKFASITMVREFLVQMPELLRPLSIKRQSYPFDFNYEIEIDDKCWLFVSALLEIKAITLDHVMDIGFDPLSAGENAILNQFAEFYQTFRYLDKVHVIVAIDEGELYLHPDWQREYIDSLYRFFKFYSHLYGKEQTYQLIVTSHSPFVVSDIPRSSLVFLEKDRDGLTKVSESKTHLPTFAGNIFELFNDGFFLTEFVSGFAYDKIDDAIKFLDGGKQNSFNELTDVEAFTKLIGESLIREELEKLIEQRKRGFGDYFEIYKGQRNRVVDEFSEKEKSRKKSARGKRKGNKN